MDNYIKKAWVEALRSGKFKQTHGRLRWANNGGSGYCCLGVLCKLTGLDETDLFTYLMPPKAVLDKVDLSSESARALSCCNDGAPAYQGLSTQGEYEEIFADLGFTPETGRKYTFLEIADIIEKHL